MKSALGSLLSHPAFSEKGDHVVAEAENFGDPAEHPELIDHGAEVPGQHPRARVRGLRGHGRSSPALGAVSATSYLGYCSRLTTSLVSNA